MKLSIVIPVYNVENYIERCLKSLFSLDIENEIILIDDGSTDRSLEIIEKIKMDNKSETITIVRQYNQGPSAARNTGIRKAKGEYISFIDSDDFVEKEKYKDLINKIISRNLDFGIGNMRKYYAAEERCASFYRGKEIKGLGIKSGRDYFIKMVKEESYYCAVYSNIYKRNFLIENNILFKEGMLCEDILFSYCCYNHAEKVEYFDIVFYNYNQENEGSIMTVVDTKKYVDAMKSYDIIFDYALDRNLSEDYFKASMSLMSKSLYWTIADTLANSSKEKIEEVFLEFNRIFKKYHKVIKINITNKIYSKYRLIHFNYKLYIFIHIFKIKFKKIRRKLFK